MTYGSGSQSPVVHALSPRPSRQQSKASPPGIHLYSEQTETELHIPGWIVKTNFKKPPTITLSICGIDDYMLQISQVSESEDYLLQGKAHQCTFSLIQKQQIFIFQKEKLYMKYIHRIRERTKVLNKHWQRQYRSLVSLCCRI